MASSSTPFNINALPYTDAQKYILQKKMQDQLNLQPTIHPSLTLWGAQSDARPFDLANGIVYPAHGAGASVILTYVVPRGLVLIVDRMAVTHLGGNPPDGTGNVIWRVLIDSGAVKGLGAMAFQFGTMAQPNEIKGLTAWENSTVQITVEVVNQDMPATQQSVCRLRGFTYPIIKATNMNAMQGAGQ